MLSEDIIVPSNIPNRHGLLIPAAIPGAAIGASRSKHGQSLDGAVRGAAIGAIVVYVARLVLGTVIVGSYTYERMTHGRDAANHAFNQGVQQALRAQ